MRMLLALLLLVAAPAHGAPIVLDFEEETQAAPFVSAECGCARFDWWPTSDQTTTASYR